MDNRELGEFQIGAKESQWTLRCDRLAYDKLLGHRPLLLLSAVGPSTTVKAVSAALATKQAVRMWARIGGFLAAHEALGKADDGYDLYRTKLGYDNWHLLAIARLPGLIPAYSDAALWQRLAGDQFTTPLLERWLPHVEARLFAERKLRRLACWQCDSALLEATSDDLDLIVSSGVKARQLAFVA